MYVDTVLSNETRAELSDNMDGSASLRSESIKRFGCIVVSSE